MLDIVSNDADANVTMEYSRLKDSFSITADTTGEESTVHIINIAGNAFGTDSAFQIEIGITQNGQNSIAVIDGVTVERSSNSYTIDGITYNLSEVTDQSDGYINFTVSRDFGSTTSAISTFVDAFNTLITKLYTHTAAADYSNDYKPLTDTQKEEMSEDQIKEWNEKAKSGILRHDSSLEHLIFSLKEAFFSSVGGTDKNTTSIGISTGSYFGSDKNTLVLDQDALTRSTHRNTLMW